MLRGPVYGALSIEALADVCVRRQPGYWGLVQVAAQLRVQLAEPLVVLGAHLSRCRTSWAQYNTRVRALVSS